MQLRSIRTATAAGAAALLLSACGGDGSPGGDPGVADDPQGALEAAMADAADWAGAQATISVDGDLQALADLEGGGEVPEEVAEAVDDGSITLAGTFDDPASFRFDLDVDGTTLLGLRHQDGDDLLAIVDLPAVRDLLDDETEAQFDEALGMAGMFGLGDLVAAFEAGDWVALVLPEDAFEGLEGGDADGGDGDDQETADREDPLSEVLDVLRGDGVTVTHVEADEHGDRLEVTVDTAEVEEALADIDPAMAGGAQGEDVPDEVTLDVWVADGQLARVAVDVAALDPELEGAGSFVVAADLSEFDGDVDLPEPATTLDLEQMFGEMFGGMSAEAGGSVGAEAEAPPMGENGLPEDFDPEDFDEGDMAELEAELEAEMEAEMEAEQGE